MRDERLRNLERRWQASPSKRNGLVYARALKRAENPLAFEVYAQMHRRGYERGESAEALKRDFMGGILQQVDDRPLSDAFTLVSRLSDHAKDIVVKQWYGGVGILGIFDRDDQEIDHEELIGSEESPLYDGLIVHNIGPARPEDLRLLRKIAGRVENNERAGVSRQVVLAHNTSGYSGENKFILDFVL